MENLTVNLMQWDLKWEDPMANRVEAERLLSQQPMSTDILIMPEMFTTGFSMNTPEICEESCGDTEKWMKSISQQFNCAVAGSIATKVQELVFNRFLFVTPSDTFFYDKRHLFRMAGEHEKYHAGDKRVVIEWKNWRIKLEVCYDLRFPVFSRNTGDYDLLINVANWPAKRSFHWKTLLLARAIENQAFVVGVNRIGQDVNGYRFSGDSLAINPKGETILDMREHEGCEQASLSHSELMNYRKKFPCHKDADKFDLLI